MKQEQTDKKQELQKPMDLPLKFITDELAAETQHLVDTLAHEERQLVDEQDKAISTLIAKERESLGGGPPRELTYDEKLQGIKPLARPEALSASNPQTEMRRIEMEAQRTYSEEVYALRAKKGEISKKIDELKELLIVYRSASNSARGVDPADISGITVPTPGSGIVVTTIYGVSDERFPLLEAYLSGKPVAPIGRPDLKSCDPRIAISMTLKRMRFEILDE